MFLIYLSQSRRLQLVTAVKLRHVKFIERYFWFGSEEKIILQVIFYRFIAVFSFNRERSLLTFNILVFNLTFC